jgi:transketolase
MVVLSPCDAIEAKQATIAAAQYDGPVYLRLARMDVPVITPDHSPFEIGKARRIREPREGISPKVGILASGVLVHEAIVAWEALEQGGIPSVLLDVHTVKPLDKEAILAVARETGALVVAEDHQRAGGLGGAVAELLAECSPARLAFVGVCDRFGSSGTAGELLEAYCLTAVEIERSARKLLDR